MKDYCELKIMVKRYLELQQKENDGYKLTFEEYQERSTLRLKIAEIVGAKIN